MRIDKWQKTATVLPLQTTHKEVVVPKKNKNEITVLVDAMKGHVQALNDNQDVRSSIVDDLRQAEKRLLRRIKKESRIVLKEHNAAKEVCYACVGCTWIAGDPDDDPYSIVMEIGHLRRKSDKVRIDDVSPESSEPAVRAELAMLRRKLQKQLSIKVIVRLEPVDMQVGMRPDASHRGFY